MNIHRIVNRATVMLSITLLAIALIATSLSQTRSKGSIKDLLKSYEGSKIANVGTLKSVESDYFVVATEYGVDKAYPFHSVYSVYRSSEGTVWMDFIARNK